MSSQHDLPYFNAFNTIPQIGSVRLRKLLNFFPNLETAWRAQTEELTAAGLEASVIEKVGETRQSFDVDEEFERLDTLQIKLLTWNDENYPKLLRQISNPPIVLYLRGEILPQDDLALAIVGTRRMSTYGKQAVQELTAGLVRAGLSIVSGLALGVDSAAHKTAVDHSGRTIAVLACGLDSIYPASNRILAEQIIESGGAIISELALGTPPLKHHFPFRNRIISGLALGTLVIEAAADSGSLITASHALEQNRQVFAVPGSIFNPGSVGPNNLLKMGAKAVTDVADILEELNLAEKHSQLLIEEIVGDNAEEEMILKILKREPLHVDLIIKNSGLPAQVVAATLTIMEMKGKARNLGANQYVISRS